MQRPADDCDAPHRARITPRRDRAASRPVSATHDPWTASAPAGIAAPVMISQHVVVATVVPAAAG